MRAPLLLGDSTAPPVMVLFRHAVPPRLSGR
jgi:hypothetical protein